MASIRDMNARLEAGDNKGVEPVAKVLGRVSDELKQIAGEVGRLQLLLSDVLLEASLRPEVLRDVQSVDHIEQKLAALSQFLKALTPRMDESWRLDATKAAETLTLHDLSHRLKPGDAAHTAEASGDFELF